MAPARVASLVVDLMEDMSTVSATTTMMVDTMATAIPDMATRMLDTAETTDMVTVDIGMDMTMGMNTDIGMDMTTLHLELAGDLASLARDHLVEAGVRASLERDHPAEAGVRASLARDHPTEEAGDILEETLVNQARDHPEEAGVDMAIQVRMETTMVTPMDHTAP